MFLCSQENAKIRSEFSVQLDQLQNKVSDMKNLEDKKFHLEALFSSEQEAVKILEKENAMLRATVEVFKSLKTWI